jgi:hypothetical protein
MGTSERLTKKNQGLGWEATETRNSCTLELA